MCSRLICCLLLLRSAALGANTTIHKTHFTVGALTIKGVNATYRFWNETFCTYLTDELSPEHGWTFELVPLDFSTVYSKVASGEIDFVYANPSIFSCLESEYQVRALVSKVNLRQGRELSSFGGTIITHVDNSNFSKLNDLKGKIVEAVSISGLGACQMQWRLLKSKGIDLLMDPAQVRFAKDQKLIVNDVFEKAVDFGFIRTDLLESMIMSGEIDSGKIKVLEPLNISGFPFQTTTELYPEWNVGYVPGVPESVVTEVGRALLRIDRNTTAARAGQYASWVFPLSYLELHKMQVELGWINATSNMCMRDESLYDAIVCSEGQAKRTLEEVNAGCPAANLPCPAGYDCLCHPCAVLPELAFTVSVGAEECETILDICGSIEKDSYSTVTIRDNLFRVRSKIGRTSVKTIRTKFRDHTDFDWTEWPMNGTTLAGDTFKYNLSSDTLGKHLLEIMVDGVQIEQSPFVVQVVPKKTQFAQCGERARRVGDSCECIPGDLEQSKTFETDQNCVLRSASSNEQRVFWVLHMNVAMLSTFAAASCLYEFYINPFLTATLAMQSTLALHIPDFVLSSTYLVFQFANLMRGREHYRCDFVAFLTFGSIIAAMVGPAIVAFATLALFTNTLNSKLKVPLSPKGLYVLIALPWILGVILAGVSFSQELLGSFRGLYCFNTRWDHGLSGGLIFTVFFLSALSTILFYAVTFVHVHTQAGNQNGPEHVIMKKAAKVVGIFFACWAVFSIVGLIHWVVPPTTYTPVLWMDTVGFLLASLQPMCNYYVMSQITQVKRHRHEREGAQLKAQQKATAVRSQHLEMASSPSSASKWRTSSSPNSVISAHSATHSNIPNSQMESKRASRM